MIYSIYNEWKNEHEIELFFGEEICPDCKGVGTRPLPSYVIANSEFMFMCKQCHGIGKVDWISRIMRSSK